MGRLPRRDTRCMLELFGRPLAKGCFDQNVNLLRPAAASISAKFIQEINRINPDSHAPMCCLFCTHYAFNILYIYSTGKANMEKYRRFILADP